MASETESDPFESPDMSDSNGTTSAWPFVIPFLAYMIIAMRTPTLGPASIDDVAVNNYFYLVIFQVVAVTALLLFFFRRYLREFPFRIDIWGFVVGVVGVVLWVGICAVGIEHKALDLIGLGEWLPERAGFNPFAQITDPSRRITFLIFRFTMLALLVPIIEELFLRGFLVRYIENPERWDSIKLSAIGMTGITAVVIYAVATHPGEAVAAALWFTMVTFLMIKTGKFWNCVVAHAVTNLLMGIYVVYASQWQLW